MRKFTKRQLLDAAEAGDGFCLRCGEQAWGVGESPLAIPCDACGAQAVLPAETLLEIFESVLIEED